MKKIYFSFILIFVFVFSGCKYGLHEVFGRAYEVNERSPVVVNLDGSSYDPEIITDAEFSVLIVNDVHFGRTRRDAGAREEDAFYAKLTTLATELKTAGYEIKFAVANGDVVEVGNGNLYSEFSGFCKEVQKIVSPGTPDDFKFYMNVGNHDLYNGGYSNWKKTAYQKVSSYKFTTGTSKKISWYFLDSGNGTLGPKQFESFKNTAMADPNPKIVFSHYPLYADGLIYFTYQNRNERDKLIGLLAKTNTMKYLSAHSHESRVDYSYGGYFMEHITQSYLDIRQFAILKIENGTCTYERYTY